MRVLQAYLADGARRVRGRPVDRDDEQRWSSPARWLHGPAAHGSPLREARRGDQAVAPDGLQRRGGTPTPRDCSCAIFAKPGRSPPAQSTLGAQARSTRVDETCWRRPGDATAWRSAACAPGPLPSCQPLVCSFSPPDDCPIWSCTHPHPIHRSSITNLLGSSPEMGQVPRTRAATPSPRPPPRLLPHRTRPTRSHPPRRARPTRCCTRR